MTSELAVRLKVDVVASELRKRLEETTDESQIRKLCRYFATMPAATPVAALAKVLSSRPKFFGLVKGYSPETRAEAARALAKAGGKDAEAALATALADPKLKALLDAETAPAVRP
jgi:hypothetical protein